MSFVHSQIGLFGFLLLKFGISLFICLDSSQLQNMQFEFFSPSLQLILSSSYQGDLKRKKKLILVKPKLSIFPFMDVLLKSSTKIIYQTLIPKICLCFLSKSCITVCFTIKFMIILIFTQGVSFKFKFFFFWSIIVQLLYATYVKNPILPQKLLQFCKTQLSISTCVCFWVIQSIPLFYKSTPLSKPHSLDYCSLYESGKQITDSSHFIFISQNSFAF